MKIFLKSVIIISSFLLATACKKNGESKLFPAHFTCEVDEVLYRGNMPYLAPPGAKRNPRTTYRFRDNFKEFRFYSAIGLLEEGKSEALNYHLFIYIPLTERLETNKEYLFEAIPGEDYGMSYSYTPKYNGEYIAYCGIYANGAMNHFSYGTGKLVIDTFTGEKGSTGSIEFTVPSPLPEDEGKILTFKGRFEYMGIQEE